jgi:hypothetical protein
MEAIRVLRKIESDTIRIPELTCLVGHEVEIIVIDNNNKPPAERYDSFFALAGTIDIDQGSIINNREQSLI